MAESCPSSLEPTAGSGFDLEPTRCQLFHQLDQIWSRSAGRSHRQTHCQPTICTRWKHSDLFPDNYLVFLFFFLGFILVLIFNCVFSTILSMVYHPQFELWSRGLFVVSWPDVGHVFWSETPYAIPYRLRCQLRIIHDITWSAQVEHLHHPVVRKYTTIAQISERKCRVV